MEFQRLLEYERKAVNECRDTVAQWEKFREDYQALHQQLITLPDQLKHDVMVPIGKHAFIPGQLYHTNEITVLLGDNWFAQVTAKQARDIVSRRQKVVEERLSDAKRQLNDIEAKLSFATAFQHQDTVEIKEESDESLPTSKKRIAHARKTPPVKANEKKVKDDGDGELWERLDELERQEEEKLQQDEKEKVDSPKGTATNVINISHTSLSPNLTSNSTHPSSGTINSPADICVKSSSIDSNALVDELPIKSKSVHWSHDVTRPLRPSSAPPSETCTAIPVAPKLRPFTGSVVEKSGTSTTTSSDAGRKVSRFKASRQT